MQFMGRRSCRVGYGSVWSGSVGSGEVRRGMVWFGMEG
jgi:hypothetical protein